MQAEVTSDHMQRIDRRVRVHRMGVGVCAISPIVPREPGEDSVYVQKQSHTEHTHVYNTHKHGTGHVL